MPGGGWRLSPPGWGRARVYLKEVAAREGVAAGHPPELDQEGRGRRLVLAPHTPADRGARRVGQALQGADRVLHRLAARGDGDRAGAALPRQVRGRRWDP